MHQNSFTSPLRSGPFLPGGIDSSGEEGLVQGIPSIEISTGEKIADVPVFIARIQDQYSGRDPETYAQIQGTIADLEDSLRGDNFHQAVHVGRELLNSSPAVKVWKERWMTTAMALYPLQRPMAQTMLDGTPIDPFARDLFLYGQDAIGIRDRGALFSHLVKQRDGYVNTICSLASGAAIPECDAIKAMKNKPNAVFVDMDRRALEHVGAIAQEINLDFDFIPVEANLVSDFLYAREPHPNLPPESFDVVDALGITEYFKDRRVTHLLKKAYELVKPGGALIFGNMLDTHPTLGFNQQIVEWPGVVPRSRELLATIASDVAGVGNVEMYIPESGIYAVLKLEKPKSHDLPQFARPLGSTALVH